MTSDRLRVGFITEWFDPETGAAAIPGVIARALNAKMDLEVLTGLPSYPQGDVYEGYRVRPYQLEYLNGLRVHRVPIMASHDDSAVRRVLTWASYAISASIAAPVVLKDCDVVLVHMTPATVALPAAVLKFLRRTPYVLHVEDLWPDTVLAAKQTPTRGKRLLEALLHTFCDRMYKGAATIAVTSPGMASKIEQRGVSSDRLAFAPNWADEEVYQRLPADPALKADLGLHAPFVVMYAGNLGQFQQLDTLIEAAHLLRGDERVEFAIVGSGVTETKLKKSVASKSLENVTFIPAKPMLEMGPIMALGDVHYIALSPEAIFDYTIPSKLQGTMASGRPIIAGLSGDAASLCEESEAGCVVPAGNPHALAEAIRYFVGNPAAVAAAGKKAQDFYRLRLSRESGTRTLVKLLRRATAK